MAGSSKQAGADEFFEVEDSIPPSSANSSNHPLSRPTDRQTNQAKQTSNEVAQYPLELIFLLNGEPSH